jgi:hypothetical protein
MSVLEELEDFIKTETESFSETCLQPLAGIFAQKTFDLIADLKHSTEMGFFDQIDREVIDNQGNWKGAFFTDYYNLMCQKFGVDPQNMRQQLKTYLKSQFESLQKYLT